MSSEVEINPTTEKYKRKRKKSFLKNARKYAKKGCFGRGSHLDVDTYQYFVRIMEVYRQGFENEEDKASFVNNVFDQTKDQEVNCCCNQVGCRVVEMLLPFANNEDLLRFIKAFNEDIRPLCSDRFASHVLETLVSTTSRKCLVNDTDSEFADKCREFTMKVSKFLLNNLEDYIWDTYGNHVIRTCLRSLAQIKAEKETKPSAHIVKEEDAKDIQIPDDFKDLIKIYGERLLCWPQFNEFIFSELTSGFLQVLLTALRRTDKKLLKSYLNKIIDENFVPKLDQNTFTSKAAMMLMETCIQIASKKQLTQIYAKCFSGRLSKLAATRTTNFAVQKLIAHCREKADFEGIYDELKDNFVSIKNVGHTGVLLALAQGCERLSTRQGSFVQEIMKSLNCYEPEERQKQIVLCLSKFTTYEELPKSNEHFQKLSLHGTLILQSILAFNKPIKVVNSILSLEPSAMNNLFMNSMGSHIVDSYVKGALVGAKSKEKLAKRLKGSYQELASSKYGSRSFEAVWNVACLKDRLMIMEELSHKNASWSNSEYGKIIASKINLVLYKRNKEEWKSSLDTASKAKELFADIVN